MRQQERWNGVGGAECERRVREHRPLAASTKQCTAVAGQAATARSAKGGIHAPQHRDGRSAARRNGDAARPEDLFASRADVVTDFPQSIAAVAESFADEGRHV